MYVRLHKGKLSCYGKNMGFPGGASGKEPSCQCRRCRRPRFNPWVRKIPWRWAWQPLQYSCMENSMHRGAYWAVVYRFPKIRTQLKQLRMEKYTLT